MDFRSVLPAPGRAVLRFPLVAPLLVVVCGCATFRHEPAARPPRKNVPAIWPTAPQCHTVTSEFGPRRRPGGRTWRQHNGIDIVAPKRSPVMATADGVVVFSGRETGYGNIIRIDHGNGTQTCYAHLQKRKAKPGQKVRRGQVIGLVGQTGNATGPHVHYEVRIRGKPTNPRPYLP